MSAADYLKNADKRSFLERASEDGIIPHRVFPFPGNGGRFGSQSFAVRSIDTGEIQRAHGEALRAVRAYGYDGADVYGDQGTSALEVERWVHVLARVLVRPDDPSRLITARVDASPEEARKPQPELIKKKLERDEVELLHNIWLDFQISRSVLSTGKLDAALEEARNVGKGLTPPQSLLRFGTVTLAYTTQLLAKELCRLTSFNSSDTSQENPSSPTSSDSFDGSQATTATSETQPPSEPSADSSP